MILLKLLGQVYYYDFVADIYNVHSSFLQTFQKSWKIYYEYINTTEKNNILASEIERTIKQGFPNYNGADYITIITQQLWGKVFIAQL